MFNIFDAIRGCSFEFRKGEQITTRKVGIVEVVEVFAMPHIDEAPGHLEQVDVHFMWIGVDKAKAEEFQAEFIRFLEPHRPLLERGPSFMTIAQEFEVEQDVAFHIMAVGQALGFWKVMTPAIFRLTGTMADRAAAQGYVMINGYKTGEIAA